MIILQSLFVVIGPSAMNLNTSPRPRAPPVFASPPTRTSAEFNVAARVPILSLVPSVVVTCASMTNTTIFSTWARISAERRARSTLPRKKKSSGIRSAIELRRQRVRAHRATTARDVTSVFIAARAVHHHLGAVKRSAHERVMR